MAWELLAIWAVVAAVIVWFFREERKEKNDRLNERAREFARTPAWHTPRPVQPIPVARHDTQRMTEIHRKFIEEVRRQSQK